MYNDKQNYKKRENKGKKNLVLCWDMNRECEEQLYCNVNEKM